MELFEDIRRHHQLVKDKGYNVIMTVLIGSQNYLLADEQSDIDTFTFVLPSLTDFALAREPVSGEFEVEDGKCMYKDMRLALNLLKKTSPNSIECFVSQHTYIEPIYTRILAPYLLNEEYLFKMVHCNYSHMLYAMAGMAHQLTKRNMPAGKRYAHSLRLMDMYSTFTSYTPTSLLLEMRPYTRNLAMAAKRDTNNDSDIFYNKECEVNAKTLDTLREVFSLTDEQKQFQIEGLTLIEELQKELMQFYLKYMVK